MFFLSRLFGCNCCNNCNGNCTDTASDRVRMSCVDAGGREDCEDNDCRERRSRRSSRGCGCADDFSTGCNNCD